MSVGTGKKCSMSWTPIPVIAFKLRLSATTAQRLSAVKYNTARRLPIDGSPFPYTPHGEIVGGDCHISIKLLHVTVLSRVSYMGHKPDCRNPPDVFEKQLE